MHQVNQTPPRSFAHLERHGVARAARVTVEVGAPAAYAAYAALVAVVRLLGEVVVKEAAREAGVGT